MVRRKSFIAALTAICFLHSLISPYIAFALENVNDKVQVIYGRPITDRRTFSKTVPISVKNVSNTTLNAPIRVVIDQITDSHVTFSNPDGITGEGKPYLEYPVNLTGNQETPFKNAVFSEGAKYRFNFSTTVFAELDKDSDGFTPGQGDCNDNEFTINPKAIDFPGDDIDQNCDGVDSVFVPKVIGLIQSSAESAITAANLTVGAVTTDHSQTVPSGIVISQNPSDGEIVPEGTAVSFMVSLGPDFGSLPPDPSEVASPIDQTIPTNIYDSTAFLYSGDNPIQTGVDPGVIEAKRAAVVRGKVLDRNNNPLAGVDISISHQPEFGKTLSRADGMFDLAVNGGGTLTIDYRKQGYLPAQRQIDVPWQDYVVVPDAMMIQLDENVTNIHLSNLTMQVARGSMESDSDGVRQATLLVPSGTQANMVFPDGDIEFLSDIRIRATEYTVGLNGAKAMPAPLPPTSGYTYAVEISSDEAILAGAKTVKFSKPVYFYVENFLGMPTGIPVPVGYYDFDKNAWVPSNDGRVIQILSITDGKAELDVDGSANPANAAALAALGITTQEREQLVGLYSPGQSLWRVPIKHLTSYDTNYGVGAEEGGENPSTDDSTGDEKINDPDCSNGSIVECENQTLGEFVPVVGTPFSLVYKSDRVPGRKSDYTLNIPLSEATLPNVLKRIEVRIEIAGRIFHQEFPPTPNQTYSFEWDGLDAYGRKVKGKQRAKVDLDYIYKGFYNMPPNMSQSFGAASGRLIPGNIPARQDAVLRKTNYVLLGQADAAFAGLGGWTVNVHHMYDPWAQVLYFGSGGFLDKRALAQEIIQTVAGGGSGEDGGLATQVQLAAPIGIVSGPDGSLYIVDSDNARVRRVDPAGIVSTVAGNGILGYGGDGGPATTAQLNDPTGSALGMDGSLYIADTENHRIRRVSPAGIITTVAGNGAAGYSGDDGLAVAAQLNGPTGLAIGEDGSLYIADTDNHRIRRIDPTGIISTVAGNGSAGFSGDNGPADEAQLNGPTGLALGNDGTLYLSDTDNHRIRKVAPSGIITTFAGKGTSGYSGDGGLALEAQLNGPTGLATGADGSLYIADTDNSRIRKVHPTGVITTFAGNGGFGYTGDGNPALEAQLNSPIGLSVGSDGSLYTSDSDNHVIRQIKSPFPGFEGEDIFLPSTDGSQIFHFDANGRHLRTLHALTGAVLFEFQYDGEGRLVSIKDGNGNVTVVERNALGNPTAIVSPDSLHTILKLNPNGYLSEITNPANESIEAQYTSDGLMISFTDGRGNTSDMTYDNKGRLTKDQNAAGGHWQLALTEDPPSGFTVEKTSALNRLTKYRIENLPTGDFKKIITDPSGLITEILRQPNAIETISTPDGVTTQTKKTSDPRFGMLAPVIQESTISTPGGLISKQITARTAHLSDPQDILSLQSRTNTVNRNGRIFSDIFDRSQMKLTSTSAQGRTLIATIDQQGRPVTSQNANLLPINMSYDSRGRLISTTQGTGADERKSTFTYNPQGFLGSVVDPLNRSMQYEYDAAGRVIREILPDDREILYTYDDNGNVTSIKPPGRPEHEFIYTSVDLVEEYSPPPIQGTGKTTYLYNLDKQLIRVTRPDGQMIQYDYDSGGRLSSMTTPRGTTTYSYSPTSGNLMSIETPEGNTLTYAYDGSLPLSVVYNGQINGTISQTYDNNFWVISQNINGGSNINFNYDNDGLLTQAGSLQIQRDAQIGFLTGTTLGNLTTGLTYNTFGELITATAKYSSTTYLSHQYTHDKLSRITQKIETTQTGTNQFDYSYDLAGRLTEVKKNSTVIATYTYDSNGNRLSHTAPGVIENGTYDDQDRLLSYGNFTYTYTANGELKSKTDTSTGQTTQYDYDLLGNLIKVVLPDGKQIEYIIDGQNRRIGKKINGTLVQGFLYQNQINPVVELDENNNILSRFVYGTKPNVPDYMVKGGKTYRIISDHLGSVRMVVDVSNGIITQKIEYDEFGRILNDSNPGFQPLGFSGGLYDIDTSLTRFGFRDYDAYSGRWVIKDPIGFESGDVNLYGYSFNNPINFTDIFGLDVWIEGPSPGEPQFHQSINVGDPNGIYVSYSFGASGNVNFSNGIEGVIYRDPMLNGEIDPNYYLETSLQQDIKVLEWLDSQVGQTAPYMVGGADCRDFSRLTFEAIEEAGIGVRISPVGRSSPNSLRR